MFTLTVFEIFEGRSVLALAQRVQEAKGLSFSQYCFTQS